MLQQTFHFIAAPLQKLCKKMGGTYANYFHFTLRHSGDV